MRHSLTTTALAGTIVLAAGCFLAGCAKTEIQPQYVSDGSGHAAVTTLPDGSQVSLLYGGVRADPQNTQQRVDGGFVHTYYDASGRLHSDLDSRPTVSPSLALELAQMVVPSTIQAAGSAGGGALVDAGLQKAGQYEAYGIYQGALANARAVAAQKPTQIGISNVNGNSNVNGAYATGGSASAVAGATQSQSLSVPSVLTIKGSSLP